MSTANVLILVPFGILKPSLINSSFLDQDLVTSFSWFPFLTEVMLNLMNSSNGKGEIDLVLKSPYDLGLVGVYYY